MGRKNQKIIKNIQKIAEDIENVGLSDSDAWRRLGQDLTEILGALPKKYKEIRALLDLTRAGLETMGDQTADDPMSLLDAVWQGLNSAEQFLSGQDAGPEQVAETRRKLEAIIHPTMHSDSAGTSSQAGDSAHPLIESLDDAAALLVQLEPENRDELLNLRTALLNLIKEHTDNGQWSALIEQAGGKIEEILEGRSQDPEQSLSEVGDLLEKAMNPIEDVGSAVELNSQPANAAPEAQPGGPAENDPDFDHMPRDADAELIAEFIAEGGDLISSAEEALLSLETDPEDMESVGKVFRAFHTVKGTSAFLGLDLLSEFGHHAESLLSRVQASLSGDPLIKPERYDELVRVLANLEASGISEDADDVATPRVGDMLVAQGKIDRKQVEEAAAAYPDQKLGAAMVKSSAATAEDVGQALRAQKRINSGQQMVDSSVRVGTQRLDRLIDMVGELVIAHSMVAQDDLVANSDNHELAKKVSHTSKIVRELQDISMSMRMVPLKGTFNKMARLVRDVARKVGKNVNFVTEGEDTEIDRNLVNIINDPLVHMVRNAVDHGIESPDERRRNGKPEYGTVRLMAYHSAGSVVVEVRDDGKGLDRSVLLAKAREKGLIGEPSDSGDRVLTDREVFNLIFEPGFSTAQVVTDVSGRGVGMDVVKKNIESLRGQVEIKSEFGKGSVFKMSLPLTLAIIDGMVVRVGAETYVIPTVSIVRSIRPCKKDLATVLNQGEVVTLQGGLIPLFRVACLYHIDGANQDAEDAVVVIVEDEDQQAGLLVDELIGRQQVVIKSLGETMKDIPGISGGAIMPDGRVGLIIDVGGLVKFANTGHAGELREEIEIGSDRSLAA